MRNYKLAVILGIFSFYLFSYRGLALAYPTAKITAKVVGEKENVIQDADVHISFEIAKKGGWGTDNFGKEGLSDSEGLFTAKANASSRIGITVRKEGYYFSRQIYEFTSRSFLNRWEPWNPTIEVVLKKKSNPVPMYQKYLEWVPVPKLDEPIGYDLERGDWVSPYGKGLVNDFVVTVKSDQRAWADYNSSYTLTFSNKKDGIQEYQFDKDDQSYYKWPFEAPEDGYISSLEKFRNDSPQTGLQSNEKKGINYIFRVRTETDKDGKIIAAKYGKIEGEIRIVPGKVQFLYYFNPDGTRNLEDDPDKNLFRKK
jgi:hypothetical protein